MVRPVPPFITPEEVCCIGVVGDCRFIGVKDIHGNTASGITSLTIQRRESYLVWL
jgi:hypothetical protein